MKVFEAILSNWELICVACGIVVNLAALVYNFVRFFRSDRSQNALAWLELLGAARKFEQEAEGYATYNAAQKLEYVLERLREFSEEKGIAFERERLIEQINADIAFSKEVNAKTYEDESLL